MTEDYKHAPRRNTYAKVYSFALEIFGYDKDKTNAFWLSKHEVLDGKAPYELVKEGKTRKLLKMMQRCF